MTDTTHAPNAGFGDGSNPGADAAGGVGVGVGVGVGAAGDSKQRFVRPAAGRGLKGPPLKERADELIPTRWSLIQRLRDWDDQESWREFFDTYWRLIYGTAMRAGLSDVEAQEVVQETVISVCRNIRNLEVDGAGRSFKNWLLKMARWRIIDQVRKRPLAQIRSFRAEDGSQTPTTERIPDPAGPELERLWEEEWRDNLTSGALARVQRQVSARHYQIFYLYVIRGAPVAQVAAATGASADEVYLVKHRLWSLFEKAMRAVELNQR